MPDILTLLQCLDPYVAPTSVRQMSRIVTAMLTMTGRVTMLGISRWTEPGGSYRTVQQFFHSVLPWGALLWVLFEQYVFKPVQGLKTMDNSGRQLVTTRSALLNEYYSVDAILVPVVYTSQANRYRMLAE